MDSLRCKDVRFIFEVVRDVKLFSFWKKFENEWESMEC